MRATLNLRMIQIRARPPAKHVIPLFGLRMLLRVLVWPSATRLFRALFSLRLRRQPKSFQILRSTSTRRSFSHNFLAFSP